MMNEFIEKAEVLVDALPYIRKFNGHTVVIKYGGSAMGDPRIREAFIQDIVLLKHVGINPVIVHGGGPIINEMLNRLNIFSEFIDGLRVTTEEAVNVVEMVLTGNVNKQIVGMVHQYGGSAVGISGKDGNLLKAKKICKNGKDLGFVGDIEEVNPEIVNHLIKSGYIPIISPIASDGFGGTYNMNADYVAVAISCALKAEKLVFLTDIDGVFLDKDDPSTLLSSLDDETALQYIQEGVIKGGMIPKVESCVKAVRQGVSKVHILAGRIEHSLLLEIYTKQGIGTMIYKKGELE